MKQDQTHKENIKKIVQSSFLKGTVTVFPSEPLHAKMAILDSQRKPLKLCLIKYDFYSMF